MPDAPEIARAQFAEWQARVAENAFDADPHLPALLRRYGRESAADELRAFGALTAGPIDRWARETNRDENLPRLRRYDDVGNRLEGVDFHPDHHAIGRAAWATGIMARYATPGRELETLALAYLLGQDGEAGHCCPLACTAGMIKILQQVPDAPAEWLSRLYDTDYDRRWHASQFLTEVQGGSDVGVNAAVARQHGDGWRIHGEKWFCSVIDAHLFLVTARPDAAPPGTAGLAAFVVPRTLPDGRVNDFAVRRLKYKLGTRSMASAEVDFQGAWGLRVADFRRTVELVLNTSRLYNAVIAAAFLQRAWREADGYARARTAFGRPILAFPSIARIVARLRTEAFAARGLSFHLADMADRMATGRDSPGEAEAWRMLVNLNKIWTALTCPAGVRDAIEVFGGNGAIEEFGVLPRLLRDSLVIEAWEGGHGVLCAQLLRDSRRRGLHRPMFAHLERLSPGDARLARTRARWERVAELPEEEGATWIRDLVEELRPVAQAAVLRGDGHPLADTAAEHLLAVTAPGWDPLEDAGLVRRVEALVS